MITKSQENNKDDEQAWKFATAVLGSVGLIAAAPLVLRAVGFTAGGVAAGSTAAAAAQSAIYGGATRGVFSLLQSAGVKGIGWAGKAILRAVGGGVGYAVGNAQCELSKKTNGREKEKEKCLLCEKEKQLCKKCKQEMVCDTCSYSTCGTCEYLERVVQDKTTNYRNETLNRTSSFERKEIDRHLKLKLSSKQQ